MKRERIPDSVLQVTEVLYKEGFKAYLVGGCVRDLLRGKEPRDFDLATDARPNEVMDLFEKAVPVGAAFGTILVKGEDEEDVHVTTFRSDLDYEDGRHPRAVIFGSSIEEDLARRDFTVNAIAWDPSKDELIDPFAGLEDVTARLIRSVGDPEERFREDALRTLRAVRFAAEFDFDIETETWRGIETRSKGVRRLSAERVRDELMKILAALDCGRALWMMHEAGLLFEALPELKGSERLAQRKRDAPTLLDHLVQTAANCPPDPVLRFAGLLHDLGKTKTRVVSPDGRVSFHGHAKVGAEMAANIAKRLRLPSKEVKRIAGLVGMHMALVNTVTKKTLRRWIGRYGASWVYDLLALGRADIIASGWRGETPVLDGRERAVGEILSEETVFSLKELAIDGNDVMQALGCGPGPLVGDMLESVYDAVLDDPQLNTRERLLTIVRSMHDRTYD